MNQNIGSFLRSNHTITKLQNYKIRTERGYILLTLLLFVALLSIAAAAIAPTIAFQIKRDREEEMIHRGVQYSRAIRRYVRKFGRYPTRIEELENTNNVRFLRRRYKDPITGKEFKLLRQGDVQSVLGSGIAGATLVSNINQATNDKEKKVVDPQSGDDKSGDDKSDSGDKLSGQVFGGGPIYGVTSTSKVETIREFNHKNHYNQWQYIYVQAADRGGLITTPYVPALQLSTPNLQQPNTGGGTSPQPTPSPSPTPTPMQ